MKIHLVCQECERDCKKPPGQIYTWDWSLPPKSFCEDFKQIRRKRGAENG